MYKKTSIIISAVLAATVLFSSACGNKAHGGEEHEYVVENRITGEYVFVDDPAQRKITENAIAVMNQESYFGYDFLSPHNDVRESVQEKCGDDWISNFMSSDYYGDGITWVFSGYPHDESGYYLTDISFDSDEYDVFGVKTGDDISSSMEVLEKQEFELMKGNESAWSDKIYNKGLLYISLKPLLDNENEDYSKIEEISISVHTFYLGNNLY